ncbi:MAG TPA: ATP-binding protein [Candidatus Acidoferrum sp.]|nr:ATP-binding protein [Candidatus Acidoferrum sp.]
MTESGKATTGSRLETSTPEGAVPLESILCTEELQRRPSRAPDYENENRALVELVSALADSPSTIFQTLAETIQDITQCDSAGLSLLTKDGKTPHFDGKRFYWPAIAGMWNPHVGGGTPRDFGPCGDVLDRNCTLLFRHFERRYPYLMPVIPAAEECLLVPFYVSGKAVGTIWAIMHSDRRKFDAEDDRVMASLGKFASSAYQAFVHIEDLKIQIAEREKAEAEVRKLASGLEARIRRLVDANVMGIFIWNLEGRVVEANEAFLHMVQHGREDLVSGRMRWTDLTPAEWRDRDARAIADLREKGTVQPYEKEFFRKDGSRVPVLAGGALFEADGSEGVAFVLNLSEQKRAQEDLRRSESYLAQAQRLALVGSWAWQIPGMGALHLSEEWYRIHGFDPKDGMPTWEQRLQRIHPEDRARYQAAVNRAIAEKSGYDVEFRILPPHSVVRFIHSVGQPVLGPSGELLQFVGVAIDVSGNRRAEEERERLRQAQADLAHLNRVSTMGELTSSVAHEIKQPISAAAADAETCFLWLASDQPDLAEAKEAALRITKDVARASDIINRIVSLFKKDVPQRELVDVNGVIQEMIALLRSEATRYSVSIHAELSAGLPKIMADRVGLQQVLMNLMLNAIEAMKQMDAPGTLTIATRLDENGQLLVSITDSGMGLPLEHAEQIFNPFFTSKPQGTGMGLPISQSIIASHGGRLWASANAERGATFQFAIPTEVRAFSTSAG